VDRATVEEQRDTPQITKDKDKQEKKDKGEGQGTPGTENVSPRANERTNAPRTSPPGRRP